MDTTPGAARARVNTRDRLVVEAPLELRMRGEPVVVVMRTPGHDRELARGLMFAEGIIDRDEPLADLAAPADLRDDERGNVLELGIDRPGDLRMRAMFASSSCGVCGKAAIADLEQRAAPVMSGLRVSAQRIAVLPERLRAAQAVFDATGGLHAAGLCTPDGALLALREDVGRHNAVDKLVGWGLGAGRVPMDDLILVVSGRIGFEIAQKASMAGIPIIVAVSAPSSLAVDVAERLRITLCGFTRAGRFNVYSHPSRIDL